MRENLSVSSGNRVDDLPTINSQLQLTENFQDFNSKRIQHLRDIQKLVTAVLIFYFVYQQQDALESFDNYIETDEFHLMSRGGIIFNAFLEILRAIFREEVTKTESF